MYRSPEKNDFLNTHISVLTTPR